MTTDNVLVAGDHYGRKHLATQWDWRNVGGRNYITPSQDQGACQASTAFAITDAMNAKLRIQFKIAVGDAKQVLVPDLSAADLFYCGGGDCGAGQDVEQALGYVATKGVVPAYNIPYKPAGGTCGRGPADLELRVTRISGFSTLRRQGAMQDAIQSRGPIVATLRAYQDLKNYRSGVYRYNGTAPFLYTQTVSVIGFTPDGWICKNSWGPGWGVGGVFTIAYGECGIDDEMMWEIAGFTKTYPYGTVAGIPASTGNAPLRILYQNDSGIAHYLSAYPPSATQPVPLDGLPGSDPSFGIDSKLQPYAFRTSIQGDIQYNIWNNGWSKVQWLTGPEGVTEGPPAVGDPAVVGGPFVLYRDADGNIHTISFTGGQWKWQQVTGGAGLKAPPAASNPMPMEAHGDLHVFYCSADGNIQDLQYLSHAKWAVQQITGGGPTGAPAAIGNPTPAEYQNLLRVFYRDKSGVVHQLWYDNGKWNWQVVPNVKTAAAGDITSVGFNGYLHLFYRESRGYIWHVYWVEGWGEEQLTGPGVSGGELAEGDPAAVSFGSEIHVLYRDINDNLSDAYWTGTAWTHLVRI